MSRNRIIGGCHLPEKGIPRGFVKLSPDKILFPGYFTPPIRWTGYIQDNEVEIIHQMSTLAYSQLNFKFIKFPEEFNDLKDEKISRP